MTLTPRHNGIFPTDFSVLPGEYGPGFTDSFDPGYVGSIYPSSDVQISAAHDRPRRRSQRTVAGGQAEVAVAEPSPVGLPTVTEAPMHEDEQAPPYVWFRQEHADQVESWFEPIARASQKNLPTDFFSDAIRDLYHYDRACRAAAVVESEPILRKDIPTSITWTTGITGAARWPSPDFDLRLAPVVQSKDRTYTLVEKKFKWSVDTPRSAVDAVGRVLKAEPPDRWWIAEYVHKPTPRVKYDPIIYAEYGNWQLEVARWD